MAPSSSQYVSTAMTTARKRRRADRSRARRTASSAASFPERRALRKRRLPPARGGRDGADRGPSRCANRRAPARRVCGCAGEARGTARSPPRSCRCSTRDRAHCDRAAVRNARTSTRAKIAKAAATRRAAVFLRGDLGLATAPQRPLCEDGLEASKGVTRLACAAHRASREAPVALITMTVMLGLIMAIIDTTIVNVAIHDDRRKSRRDGRRGGLGRDRLHPRQRRRSCRSTDG